MAEPQEKIIRPRRLMPAMEFAYTRLSIAKNEAIGGQILQRKLYFWADAAELCEAVLPVIVIGCHPLRSIHRVGLSAGLSHPGVPHQHHPGLASSPTGSLPIGVDQAQRALQIGAGGSHKGVAEASRSAHGGRDAGTDPQ